MGFKHRFHQLLGGSLTAVLMLSMSPALAEELRDWSFDTTNSELTFSLANTLFPEFFLLSEPPRLVLDIPASELGTLQSQEIYNGVVQTIRVAQHTSDQVRVVIELVPDIVLDPDQADIQFDDGENGQRHWRFRPLIADEATPVTVVALETPSSRSNGGVSLSADNLKLPGKPAITAALPIDPYVPESASSVVSVPPLEEALAPEPSPASVTTVPPLDELTVDVSPVAAAPDLPPMTVPELEEPTLEELDPSTVAAVSETNRSSLPDISGESKGATAPAFLAEPSNLGAEPEPSNLDGDVPMPTDAVVEDLIEVTPDETVVEELVPTNNVDGSNVAAVASLATEAALAPVQILGTEAQVSEIASPETIQQPAANRTIVQTEAPAPLSFGQPLPTP